MNKKVVIIGAGEIGMAIGGALSTIGHEVTWWDAASGKVTDQKPLVDILPSAEFVFYCVPSWALRPAIVSTYPHLSQQAVAITLTKGLEDTNNKTADELLAELLPSGQRTVVFGGPMLAEEIMKKNFAFATLGTKDAATGEMVRELFAGTPIKVGPIYDPRAVSLAGVLKNIYTFAIGFSDALNLGDNTRGLLVVKAMDEMEAIFTNLKLDTKVIIGPAGLGDLVATGTASGSRNRQTAAEIVTSGHIVNKSEGVASIESLIFLLGGNTDNYPLLRTLAEIILDHADAATLMANYLQDYGNQ